MIKSIFAALTLVFLSVLQVQGQIAIKAGTIYTMEGNAITDGIILVKDGTIEQIGSAASVKVPDNYQTYEAKVATPGLIDAHTVVGLSGIFNQNSDQDQLETSDAIQPQLRAIDAYNAREELVTFVMEKGVTTIHTGHGPGALASGQTMIAKTGYTTVEEALIDSVTMVAMTLGAGISSRFSSPGTRAKGMSMLRQKFINAEEYADKRKNDSLHSKNLEMEILADILDGKITALITVNRSNDIMTALRLHEEFGFNMVLDGAAEAYLLLDEIKEAGVPVFIHPTKVRTGGSTRNASFETAGKLAEAGIPFAFQSGYEAYVPKTRIILFEAAIAVANGLSKEAALKALTIDPAIILNIDSRVGSLKTGKDADIVLYDGDPFEYTTHITNVFIDGRVVKE